MPSCDSTTCAHIDGEGKQVIIQSTDSVNLFGLMALEAPKFINLLTIRSSMSKTVKSIPFLSRLPASLPPTLPSPINPIFMESPKIFLL